MLLSHEWRVNLILCFFLCPSSYIVAFSVQLLWSRSNFLLNSFLSFLLCTKFIQDSSNYSNMKQICEDVEWLLPLAIHGKSFYGELKQKSVDLLVEAYSFDQMFIFLLFKCTAKFMYEIKMVWDVYILRPQALGSYLSVWREEIGGLLTNWRILLHYFSLSLSLLVLLLSVLVSVREIFSPTLALFFCLTIHR